MLDAEAEAEARLRFCLSEQEARDKQRRGSIVLCTDDDRTHRRTALSGGTDAVVVAAAGAAAGECPMTEETSVTCGSCLRQHSTSDEEEEAGLEKQKQ